ncbi:MAG: HIT family protein [Candidatus Zhuqueibacterota bacterium]
MEILWAPWRIQYIEQPKPEGCIFCDKPSEDRDRENLILFRGDSCFVIMNFYPYNNGHLMVVPFRHTSDISSLTDGERVEMMELLAACKEALTQTMSPHAFNIGMNLGEIAGAGVKDHLHFHIVPRWRGDTNFMPIFGHTKVVSEGLTQTWEKLNLQFKAYKR